MPAMPAPKSSTFYGVKGLSPTPSRIGSNGPSQIEPALIASKWGIGWQTPVLMVACYIVALFLAILHFLFFRYIDGTEAAGPNQFLPQTYVITISNIISNAFGFALRAALAVAFVQHMWYLLRMTATKVSTIELLFSIRTNLFMLCMPAAVKAAPLLVILALIMWASQVVTNFPPGAINVTTAMKETYEVLVVPSFNASFMGNGSGADAGAYSLVNLTPFMFGFTTGSSDAVKDGNLLNRLARKVLIAGDTLPISSPCGVNCTYTTVFEGPWLKCNSSRAEIFKVDASQTFPIYSGKWNSFPKASLAQSRYNGTYTLAHFNSSTLFPLEANGTDINGPRKSSVLLQNDTLVCLPGRARHTVTHIIENNIFKRQVTTEPLETLRNLALLTYEGVISVGGFAEIRPGQAGFFLGTKPAAWSPETLAYYRDNNMMAIITAVMSYLAGDFYGFLAPEDFRPVVYPGNYSAYELAWNEIVTTKINGLTISESAQNGTVIDSTRFNLAANKFTAFNPSHPAFNMTEALLNEYLFNMTTAVMSAYGNWNVTANATRLTNISVYTFSEPLNLILPYFVTLLVSLPFVVLGVVALLRNGVSAMDNSFIQTIATSTGSATLDRAAAGGCLGGNESVPQELKDLKIRFGEIISRDEPGMVKRAGFGVESEITSLRKGTNYGIARWV